MDNLTHTLIGATLANAGLRDRFGRGATVAMMVSSNLPDVDVFWGLFDPAPSFVYRRMFTHAVLGLPLLAALGAWVHRRFELAWVFIIDLALWFFMLTPFALSRFKSQATGLGLLARAAGSCVLIYLTACGVFYHRSQAALQRFIDDSKTSASFSCVFPEPFGPQFFRGVVREGNTFHTYRIDARPETVTDADRAATDDGNADVRRILATREGGWIAWFAKAPVWTAEGTGENGARRWLGRVKPRGELS